MRYMMLIYSREDLDAAASREAMQAVAEGHRAAMQEAAKKGILRGADKLKPTATATTVRMQNGQALTTDGPFAETKEQLAGYYILECQDLDEAIDWAKKIPTACMGGQGCVEIRPIVDISKPF
jgi:hypothetical protein